MRGFRVEDEDTITVSEGKVGSSSTDLIECRNGSPETEWASYYDVTSGLTRRRQPLVERVEKAKGRRRAALMTLREMEEPDPVVTPCPVKRY